MVLLVDTKKDAQLFCSRDLFDDAASEYTGALIINGRAEGGAFHTSAPCVRTSICSRLHIVLISLRVSSKC